MWFDRTEKVFSLNKTANLVLYTDAKSVFEEFFCYLLIGGLFDEGNGSNVSIIGDTITNSGLSFGAGCYQPGLGHLISKGLKERIITLLHHLDVGETDREFLRRLDYLFSDNKGPYRSIKGSEFISIADRYKFSEDMKTIAHYVAIGYGQRDFPEAKSLPQFYLSLFGNIHLSKHDKILVSPPSLVYGTQHPIHDRKEIVSLTYSLMSGLIDGIVLLRDSFHGDYLGEMFAGWSFLASPSLNRPVISVERYTAALRLARTLDIQRVYRVPMAVSSYREMLFGSLTYNDTNISVNRYGLLQYLINLMVEKADVSQRSHLFCDTSAYRRLCGASEIDVDVYKTPSELSYALEALGNTSEDDEDEDGENNKDKDSDATGSEDPDTKDTESQDEVPSDDDPDANGVMTEEAPSQDPQTDTNGFDPGNPPPLSPTGAPTQDKGEKKENNIDLISFDKTGEGVNEDLYRAAVVALNDRLQRDDTVRVPADKKDALDYWVNGFLYRTAIEATKEQISSLDLQSFLKNV
jgi:hypothetical protein